MRRAMVVFACLVVLTTTLTAGLPRVEATTLDSEGWTLIIAPTHEGGHTQEDALAFRDYLLEHGWDDERIIFLTDGLNESFVDNSATVQNIIDAMNYIAENANEHDLVVIIVLDRGVYSGESTTFQANDGNISDSEFGTWLNNITYREMVVCFSFNYSGGFIEECKGSDRLVITSHSATESTVDNTYNLTRGLSTPKADADNDGTITVEEAHNYECSVVTEQTPQMDDQTVDETLLQR